jgi:hypothetical protein
MDNIPDDELEIGTEYCPICNALNNPAAAEFNCNHFIGMYWENELHWSNSQLEQLIDLVDFVQGRLESNPNSHSEDKDLSSIFEIGYTNTADVISEILGDRIRKTEVKSDNGEYIHWYIGEIEFLDKLIDRLRFFNAALKSNNL